MGCKVRCGFYSDAEMWVWPWGQVSESQGNNEVVMCPGTSGQLGSVDYPRERLPLALFKVPGLTGPPRGQEGAIKPVR